MNSTLKGIKIGDTKAFSLFYSHYYPSFFRFANSYVRDEYISGNLVQDAFMSIWENREALSDDMNLPAYVLTIIKNNALNHLKRLKTKNKVQDNIHNHYNRELELRCSTLSACDPNQLFFSEVEIIIKETIDALPTQCRKVFLMSRMGGLSNQEIANKLKITIKGVEHHITKSLKIFRKNLSDYLYLFLITLGSILK